MKILIKHNWFPLCSDINVRFSDTFSWWRCANCGEETKHTKERQCKPLDKGCSAKEKGSIFPLSSI